VLLRPAAAVLNFKHAILFELPDYSLCATSIDSCF
jgi:hypothetical protein